MNKDKSNTKQQCVRCGKLKLPEDFHGKTDHCETCHKPEPKSRIAVYNHRQMLAREAQQRRANNLAGAVKTTYMCICAKNPDNCKATEHTA